MEPGLLTFPWAGWAVLAFMVAGLFALIVPGADEASGIAYVVLRWFHALVWVLLGLSALVRGFLPDNTLLADILAWLALALFVVYLVTLVRQRASVRATRRSSAARR